MEYLQSWKNIEVIKDSIRPNGSAFIFFDFYDLQNFKIIFIDDTGELPALRSKKYKQNLPLAIMFLDDDTGEEILHYRDASLQLEYNLTFERLSQFVPGLKILRQESRLTLANQFLSLVAHLKK